MGQAVSSRVGSLFIVTAVLALSAALQPACAPPLSEGGRDDEENVGTTQQQLLVTGAPGQWVWNDVVGSKCGRGQQTGFGISKGTSSEVLIFLEGGGLCWDETTCNFNGTDGIAFGFVNRHYNEGYNASNFPVNGPTWSELFARNRADNPYKNATMIYVPYCTGDFHSGDGGYGNLLFKGRKNLELFLQEIVPGLPGTTKVTLAGTSAGGFGATFNFWRVANAFGPSVRTDLVADSGPILWNNAIAFTGWSSWNASGVLPPDCTTCSTFKSIYNYNAQHYPNSRLAFTTWDEDALIAMPGYGIVPFPSFYNEIGGLAHGTLKQHPNSKFFIAAGPAHGMLTNLDIVSRMKKCNPGMPGCVPQDTGDSITLGNWLTQMNTDNPHWRNWSTILGSFASPDNSDTCAGKVCGGNCGGCYPDESCSVDQARCFTGCEIGGVAYAAGAVNPARSCEVCTPSANAYGWSVAANKCSIGGQCYSDGARDATGCKMCVPATSSTAFTTQTTCTNITVVAQDVSQDGDFGYATANAACASDGLATFGAIPGTWRSLVSTGTLDYKDIVPLAHRTKPVVNFRGETIFTSWNAMLTNQVWAAGPSMYDFDNVAYAGQVWSGTLSDGTKSTQRCGSNAWSMTGYWNPLWIDSRADYGDWSTRKMFNAGAGTAGICQTNRRIACVHLPPN